MSELGLVPVQMLSFLWAIAIGAGLGLLYDCFRIARIALPSPSPVVVVQDVLFGLLAAIVSFGYMLTVTDGKLRFILLIGEGIGWALYYATIGDMVMALSHFIIAIIRRIFAFMWRIAVAVARALHWLFIRPVLAAAGWFSGRCRAAWRHIRGKTGTLKRKLGHIKLLKRKDKSAGIAAKGIKMRIKSKFSLQTKE